MDKCCKTLQQLECSVGLLRDWIEFQLHSGMTFKNYGSSWRIETFSHDDLIKRPPWQLLYPILIDKNIYKGDKFALLLQDVKVKMFEILEMKCIDDYASTLEEDEKESFQWVANPCNSEIDEK